MTNRGKFIVFEGIDGSGKTTHAKLLAQWLPDSGLMPEGARVVLTREPAGTGLGSVLGDLIQGHAIHGGAPATNRTRLLLYAADRAQHVEEVIQPALAAGNWLVCDRYTASTLAYQGYGHGLPRELIRRVNALATTNGTELIVPDLTIWLDVTVNTGSQRVCQRDGLEWSKENVDHEFLTRVRKGYWKILHKDPTCLKFGEILQLRDLSITEMQTYIRNQVREFAKTNWSIQSQIT
jgi:dTMP kinase